MTVEHFRVRISDNVFVFIEPSSIEKSLETANVLKGAGGRPIGKFAWSFDSEKFGNASAIAELFEQLGVGENIYVLTSRQGGFVCEILSEANANGGITVGP